MRRMPQARPTDPVRKVMMWPVAVIDGAASMRQAAEALAADEIGVLLVLEHGALVGVVSERDLVRHVAEDANPDHLEVRDIMTVDLVAVAPNDTVLHAAQQMLIAGVRHLPVQEDDRLAGVVSVRDVLAALADEAAR
jgi:signal-transduction protein with cAMP-binding, CBS, and nucleotidyltransferase domain